MAEATGPHIPISLETEIHGNVAKQFDDPELSDVTLKVGKQSYHAHRFVISAQSIVFRKMLQSGEWKESNQKVIDLEESPECQAVFGDFLRLLYSGKVVLTCDNVCGIHMLADKYDVPALKEETVTAMKAILLGTHGHALQSSIGWLRYIEQFVPEILPICYEALRKNFNGLHIDIELINNLESRDITAILTSSDIVVYNEWWIFLFVSRWASLKFRNLSEKKAVDELTPILELVRFYNIYATRLQAVEDSDLCKAIGKSFINDFLFPAYKIHSQIQCIALDRSETLSGNIISPGQCPYDCGDDYPHLNPRLYVIEPYGKGDHLNPQSNKVTKFNPVDLADVRKYAKLRLALACLDVGHWKSTQENEIITLTPSSSHVGRQYTVAITVMTVFGNKFVKYLYTMKRTGTIKNNTSILRSTKPIQIHLPARPRGESDTETSTNDDGEKLWIGVTVHLHK